MISSGVSPVCQIRVSGEPLGIESTITVGALGVASAVGAAVGGTVGASGVAAGAQAESKRLTNVNVETSNLRVFILSLLL